jgi:predicted DNA-binding protein (MmcQ/YjbR family)
MRVLCDLDRQVDRAGEDLSERRRSIRPRRWGRLEQRRGQVVIIPAMRAALLRGYCLAFPGSVETFPFGPETSVFKVAGRMFALSQLARRPLQVSVKCEPPLAQQLRDAHPAVLPGYHLNKRHWNTVIVDGSLPEQMIKHMIEDSYDLVVSKLPVLDRRALGWSGDGAAREADASR